MARYFFDHSVGVTINRDETGTVCANDQSAIKHAWSALPNVLTNAQPILPWQHFELVVRREDGVLVGRVGMTIVVEAQNPATVASLALNSGRSKSGADPDLRVISRPAR